MLTIVLKLCLPVSPVLKFMCYTPFYLYTVTSQILEKKLESKISSLQSTLYIFFIETKVDFMLTIVLKLCLPVSPVLKFMCYTPFYLYTVTSQILEKKLESKISSLQSTLYIFFIETKVDFMLTIVLKLCLPQYLQH